MKTFGSILLTIALCAGFLALTPACGDNTTRYAICLDGPIEPQPTMPPAGSTVVWTGDGDINCWRDDQPVTFRKMSPDETPASACEFCEAALLRSVADGGAR